MVNSDKYYELSSDVIKNFTEIFNSKSFPREVNFLFQGNAKQKTLIQISKIPEKYSFPLNKEILVSINEDIYDRLDEESIVILFSQEIDKVSINMNNGTIKMNKPDLTTFSGIVNKFGIDKVARANEVENLSEEQAKDAEKDNFLA